MAAPAATPRTGFKFMISMTQGPDRGASYQLLPPKVTIGRGPENNIVLKDPRVSRSAASIEFSNLAIMISDLSGRSTLFVNGEQVTSASIKDGDLIQVGETQFSFNVEAIALGPPAGTMSQALAPRQPTGLGPAMSPGFPGAGAPPLNGQPLGPSFSQAQRPVSRNRASGSRMPFVIICLVLAAVVYFLMTDVPTVKKEGPVLRTPDIVEKELKDSEERLDLLSKKRVFKTEEERTRFEEAQKHYLEGFRDYQKSQWIRAMRSFETARAIDPDHVLALRYYRLAEKQRDEGVALLILEGRRYRDKNMFTRCAAAFDKVMSSIPNRDDAKYKEAEQLKKECDFLENERYQ